MAKDLKSVLEPTPEPEMDEEMGEETEQETDYDAYTSELADVLGLDESKAARLKEAICGIMEAERMKDMEPESGPEKKPGMSGGKKRGLAIVLG